METVAIHEKHDQGHYLVDSYSDNQLANAVIDLPIINLGPLLEGGDLDKVAKCKNEIAEAATEWGFFQVVNHGISSHVLERMVLAQHELFRRPFEEKKACVDVASGISYRQGSNAFSLGHLSLTEVFHIPISHIFTCEPTSKQHNFRSMEQYAREVADLAMKLIKALVDELGRGSMFFDENCNPGTSFLRLNKYHPSPSTAQDHTYGLVPHTDTDLLTILYQDHVGGLQVLKDGKWISVKPNPAALVVNIGDLLQAWSNDVYKSVKHKVLTNQLVERYSIAYFMSPNKETLIESQSNQPRVYRTFSYGEYRDQVDEDAQKVGTKFGLTRFLAS